MTSPIIPSRPFDHPAAWAVADIGGKDAFAFDLDDDYTRNDGIIRQQLAIMTICECGHSSLPVERRGSVHG